MDDRQFRETARNIRSDDFLTARAADFAGIPAAAAMIVELTAKAAKVAQEYQNQLSKGGDARQDYSIYKDAIEDLEDEMKEIRDIAVSMAKKIPGLEEKFRIPRGGNAALIASGYVFADDAEAIKQSFEDYGMDKNFITRLRTKADFAAAAKAKAEASTGGRVGATSTLEQDVDDASDLVESLNPIVKKIYRNNPANLAAWKFASRVERHTPVPRVPKPPQ